MKKVEYWRWRYIDRKTGRVCRTMFQMSEEESRVLLDAERIPGTMLVREIDDTDDGRATLGVQQARVR